MTCQALCVGTPFPLRDRTSQVRLSSSQLRLSGWRVRPQSGLHFCTRVACIFVGEWHAFCARQATGWVLSLTGPHEWGRTKDSYKRTTRIGWNQANPGPPTTRCSSSPRGGDGSRGDAEETRGDRERRSIYLNKLAFALRGAFLFLSRPQTTHHFPKPAASTRLLHSNVHHCSSLAHGRAKDSVGAMAAG